MSQPSKEQWAEITQKIDSLYGGVHLRCNGYLFTSNMDRRKNKLVINVYINGFQRGEWFGFLKQEDELSDIQRRFCQASTKCVWPRNVVTDMEKILGKRRTKKEGYYKKNIIVSPVWSSAKRLVSHLKKHNKNIEVLTYDEYKTAIDALPKEAAQ